MLILCLVNWKNEIQDESQVPGFIKVIKRKQSFLRGRPGRVDGCPLSRGFCDKVRGYVGGLEDHKLDVSIESLGSVTLGYLVFTPVPSGC